MPVWALMALTGCPVEIASQLWQAILQRLPRDGETKMTIRTRIQQVARWLRIAAAVLGILLALGAAAGYWLLQARDDLDDLGWLVAESSGEPTDAVTVTWLGVTTLLFDDNETQILIDGFFTRVSLFELLCCKIETDIANVNYAMSEFHINRLAAIVPVHSHFDHAMDVGVVANRSNGLVLGSESTANIVRGSQLPVGQYQILADGETRQFGEFSITLIASKHAPVADRKQAYFPGEILEPLQQPARVDEWKEGVSYSIVIAHPRGTTLIQGSAGYVPGNLEKLDVDVVMLSVAGLQRLGRDYAGRYWRETVTATGARRVYPIHFDDFTKPFGEVALLPSVVDKTTETAVWINDFANKTETPVDVIRLPLGRRIELY